MTPISINKALGGKTKGLEIAGQGFYEKPSALPFAAAAMMVIPKPMAQA